jgi:hypothetical protein
MENIGTLILVNLESCRILLKKGFQYGQRYIDNFIKCNVIPFCIFYSNRFNYFIKTTILPYIEQLNHGDIFLVLMSLFLIILLSYYFDTNKRLKYCTNLCYGLSEELYESDDLLLRERQLRLRLRKNYRSKYVILTKKYNILSDKYKKLQGENKQEESKSQEKKEITFENIIEHCSDRCEKSLADIYKTNTIKYNYDDFTHIHGENSLTVLISDTQQQNEIKESSSHRRIYLEELGNTRYVDEENVQNYDEPYYKVIIKEHSKNFENAIVGLPSLIHTKSFRHFKVEGEGSAGSLRSYLGTTLPNKIYKMYGVHTVSGNSVSNIPLVPLNRNWTDEKVYEYFDFSKEQIKFIESL